MSSPARGVLIVAGENYPPWTSPGSIRLARMSELLGRHGWHSVVLSCRPPGDMVVRLEAPDEPTVEVHRTIELDPLKALFGRRELRRAAAPAKPAAAPGALARMASIARRAYGTLCFPDRDWLWIPVAVATGMRLLRSRDRPIELIYSSSPSISAHVVAGLLSRLAGRPWVAEFRDTWASSVIRAPRGPVRRRLEHALERRIISSAERIVSVSRGYLDELRATHPIGADRAELVFNGFDPRDFREIPPPASFERFSLAHAGHLYGGRRGLTVLFRALRSLIDEGAIPTGSIGLDFYGERDTGVDAEIHAFGLADVSCWHDYLPYPEMLRALARSYLLLLPTHQSRPTLPSKIFDYLGVRRPILAIAHETSEVADIVREIGHGQVVTHGDVERMREVLVDYWTQWRRGAPLTSNPAGDEDGPYTRQRQASKLAMIFDRTRSARQSPSVASARPDTRS